LNVIEWGDGIYGAEAAARTYFGRPAAVISGDQAALLAAAIINPRLLNPGQPTARLRRRQRMILRRMGMVTPPPAAPAQQVDAPPAEHAEPSEAEVLPGTPMEAEPPPPASAEPSLQPVPTPPPGPPVLPPAAAPEKPPDSSPAIPRKPAAAYVRYRDGVRRAETNRRGEPALFPRLFACFTLTLCDPTAYSRPALSFPSFLNDN
jgi:membrane peptidoglycan carboxypeptidase